MLGRLLSCVIAQIPNLRALLIHNIFLFLAGISCVVMPFCKTYIAMAVSAFGYGFFIGKSSLYLHYTVFCTYVMSSYVMVNMTSTL